jgi:hypothetical protein
MSRTRFRIVLILLVLILLMASAVFGVLTYWLGVEDVPAPAPGDARLRTRWGSWAGSGGSCRPWDTALTRRI